MKEQGLYNESFEHDNCGIGAVVSIKGIKTHQTVSDALSIVENLEHRAGKDASGETGDGVGILLQISHDFFSGITSEIKNTKTKDPVELGDEGDYGIAMLFLPRQEIDLNRAKRMFEITVEKENLEFLGWRNVPVKPAILGKMARDCMPNILQGFVRRPKDVKAGWDFERRLYVARRVFEQTCDEHTYVASFSSRTIVYKGMFLVNQLRAFFSDLENENYKSAIALVHSRFSTNTNPSWERAHPNRFIVHNGEINTIKGNADKMLAREETMVSDYMEDEMGKITPVVNTSGSDSAMLDNTLEFLAMNGMPLPLAVMITIPEPWCHNKAMPQEKKDFYQYYATMMEPWDGPASILFSDGELMGAVLDRNGLRPSRYYVTNDDYLILSSEVGVLPIEESRILSKQRLKPGKMLLVDTKKGILYTDEEIKEHYANRAPYGLWLDQNLNHLHDLKIPNVSVPFYEKEERTRLQKAFGYTYEDVRETILPMAETGSESIGSMGVDSPLAVLSDMHRPLFDYFKQLFAQVTNPPIDSIREKVVTSTTIFMGSAGNVLREKEENCHLLRINNPILTDTDLLKIKHMKVEGFSVATIPITYYKNTSLEKAIERLFVEADRAYRDRANIIILSDRGVDENHVAIPSLLAVSALQQHLVRTKKRTQLSLIIESGEPRSVHHFATLLGFGASAVNPYLAHESIQQLIHEGLLHKDYHAAVDDYNEAVISGIIKIASKMGISTIQSYQGAKIFEAVGIHESVINKYFTGCISRIGGKGISDIEKDVEYLHDRAFDPLELGEDVSLDSMGVHKFRSGKEEHLYNPQAIHLLQHATRTGDYEKFKEFTDLVNADGKVMNLRGLFGLKYAKKPIDIDEVESVDEIVRRFKTGAMSYGSISKEAHETMAIAMNMLHGRSNSGEGGEEPERLLTKGQKVDRCSAIKQVASARFGVTSEYLVSADEIQIKMAQGAKPGEGGHLPGKKVYPWIAKTRLSTPGVALISPPPHHDIYSIEDLAELIYDLKNANKDARISVKLVSEAGVGTVASGVAKAGAQVILISGYDGGTGAAPVTSIHNAGMPWEIGLAETHQTLIQNGLRNKVVIETDGKLLTGRDVAIACMLGAEEFGFATAPLVTMGCVMMRACQKDTCPMGVATQNPELRKRFSGKPEYVVNFMRFVAQNLREVMASLGVRTVDELVGRSDLLEIRDDLLEKKHLHLNLDPILYQAVDHRTQMKQQKIDYHHKDVYDFKLEETPDEKVLLPELKKKKKVSLQVSNVNRSFGTLFGAELTREFKTSLEEDAYRVNCHGAGGQSFGAFIPKGLTISLEGDSNDYFGKGLSGGKLIVHPHPDAPYAADENIIIGNVALYGATSGTAYICGVAGERFAVRNSGATAVLEGCGDHGCEYMTGGRVVVLGHVGKNFAAGMSGGIAYVLDEHQSLYKKVNKTMVALEQVTDKYDVQELKEMIQQHVEATGSEKGKKILSKFTDYLPKFKKIIPHDYKKVIMTIVSMEEKGLSHEQAEYEAFEQLTGEKM
ncbi:MAG: glutamate synthase large subunit [Lachnospiraceae bacterium]|nr:glutamate synthase large subunit [Lachnospiraceae bacterium]